MRNRAWTLTAHPEPGELIGKRHFALAESDVPALSDGQILVRTVALGTSPAQRAYASSAPAMHPKVPLGAVMRGRGVGVVVQSKDRQFHSGDIVEASLGWQEFAVLTPAHAGDGILRIAKLPNPMRPLTRHLGVLGGTGATAWFGLFEVGQAKPDETVVISAAAGGVGTVAVQLAKRRGCRVIGIVGSDAKARWITSALGADAAIDYKHDDVAQRLRELCPDGIDVYFDNVGGALLDIALTNLALHARVVICGFISTAQGEVIAGPKHYPNLLRKRARMEGFFVMDYLARWDEAHRPLRRWLDEGAFDPAEDVEQGLERMPDALASLFTGANCGIKLCRVAADP
jgi:NADPH-dependent curcumin reductase